jgi:riboflavin-specific deaminase-like protein
LIGAGTVAKDDPSLTVRLVEGRNPQRIILDTKLRLKSSQKLFRNNSDKNLIVVTSEKSISKRNKIKKLNSSGINIIHVKEDEYGNLDLKSILKELGKLSITSVLVEGGNKIFTSFVKNNLYDDILLFITPKILGKGVSAIGDLGIYDIRKAVKVKVKAVETIGDDILVELVK